MAREGCAHVTALLQAMAPAVVQSTWSMGILNEREPPPPKAGHRPDPDANRRRPTAATCGLAGGELVTLVQRGETLRPMLPVRDRLVALGRDPQVAVSGYSEVGPVNSAARFSRNAARPSAASGPPKP